MSGDGWKHMPNQPQFCSICNKRIILGRDSVWFKTSDPKASFHMKCRHDRWSKQLV